MRRIVLPAVLVLLLLALACVHVSCGGGGGGSDGADGVSRWGEMVWGQGAWTDARTVVQEVNDDR